MIYTITPNQTYEATDNAFVSAGTNTMVDQGSLTATDGATLSINSSVEVNGEGVLTLDATGTLNLRGNLLGNTTNADQYDPMGTIMFDGSGGSSSPQLLEAMSDNLGAVQGGFQDNFAYGTLSLNSSAYVQLEDESHNSTGTGSEAVYANELIVPYGATLDLNGLHMYVRGRRSPAPCSTALSSRFPAVVHSRRASQHPATCPPRAPLMTGSSSAGPGRR